MRILGRAKLDGRTAGQLWNRAWRCGGWTPQLVYPSVSDPFRHRSSDHIEVTTIMYVLRCWMLRFNTTHLTTSNLPRTTSPSNNTTPTPRQQMRRFLQ